MSSDIMSTKVYLCAGLVAWLVSFAIGAGAALRYTGVNLSGAEFGQAIPGTYNIDYIYPNQAEVDYFQRRGMNIIRLPFRWERLQRTTNAAFNATEFNRLHGFVSAATAKGMHVILEPHNFARYEQNGAELVIGGGVSYASFADFWSRLATVYRTNDHVFFNLMNEPNTMPTEQWLAGANAAIAAIRQAGATNLILVPGNAWTGAWTWSDNWYGTPNAQVMLGVIDPVNNYAYDVHQYLDTDGSGSSATIVNANIGATRVSGFTQWLRTHNRRGFLGEFAVANSTIGAGIGDEAIANLLNHLNANSDVWLGWTWWSAGPWWGEYQFTLEPIGGVSHRPAMNVLLDFIPVPVPELVLTGPREFRFKTWPGFHYQTERAGAVTGEAWLNHAAAINGAGQTVILNIPAEVGATGFFRVRVTR